MIERAVIGSARGVFASHGGPDALAVLWHVIQIADREVARIQAKVAAEEEEDENKI